MKVLITGATGFIGKNLIFHLQEKEDMEIITYTKEDSFDKIETNIDKVDYIFHLAGVNRPKIIEEFYEGNYDLTKKIVDIMKNKNLNIPFIYTSSIQAELDNDYGKSKKQAENYIKKNIECSYIFRLHNVFGKWCKPNYNSVIATFCYNIAHDLEITKNKELELIYIDDICETFMELLDGVDKSEVIDNIHYIIPRYKKTLGEITKKMYEFKENMNSIYVPNTGDEFVKKLFATYISYLPLEKLSFSAKKNVDERGSFTELVRTLDSGQFSISFSKPGIVRGNHYHHTKMERFIVVKGKAKISFRSIISDDYIEFEVDDKEIKIITIPVGYTHNIENIGDDEMILILWCNELFNQNHPDTYFKEVKRGEV